MCGLAFARPCFAGDEVEANTPTQFQVQATQILVTDASMTGWGAIFFDGRTITTACGPFTEAQMELQINAKEAISIRNASEQLNLTNTGKVS